MGECHVHAGIDPENIRLQRSLHPGAEFLIHPECGCTAPVLWARSDGQIAPEHSYVLSTEKMLTHARQSTAQRFLVATETGILHRLSKELPDKRFEAADPNAVCHYMKMITPLKLRNALRDMAPQIEIDPCIASRARVAIERMLAVPASKPSFE